jgi:beta-lactam-binding protein with PASTA domain
MFKGIWLIIKNILLMLLVLIGLGVIAFFVINVYTRKGQTTEVPKITGMHFEKAIEVLEENDLDYIIVDSVFDENVSRHHVTDQSPAPMSKVKRGRKIYLTVNSLDVPEVEMPDIAGKMSFEQAKKTLQAKGLVLGKITEQPDPSITSRADKPVFEQLYRGDPITPGTKIKRKSKIDLVVGVMEGVNLQDSTMFNTDTVPVENPNPDASVKGIDY